MSAPSPYQLEQAFSALLSARQRLLEEDPDIANDEKLFADMLEGESGDAMEVLDRVLRASLDARDMAEAAKTRSEEVWTRYERFNKRASILRGVAFAAMDALGIRKREMPDLTASIAAGRQSVLIVDEAEIPEHFFRTRREIDKAALSQALKSGEAVAGAELSNGIPTLQVRTK